MWQLNMSTFLSILYHDHVLYWVQVNMAKGKINGEIGKNAKSKTNPIEEVNAKEDSLFIKDHLPSLYATHPTTRMKLITRSQTVTMDAPNLTNRIHNPAPPSA